MKIRQFELHWLTGQIEIVKSPDLGNQLNTLANAMNNAGIGNGALPVLDYWREIRDERQTKLLSDLRPFGTYPYWAEDKNVDYWHNRAKLLGAVWSRQRTEFILGVRNEY